MLIVKRRNSSLLLALLAFALAFALLDHVLAHRLEPCPLSLDSTSCVVHLHFLLQLRPLFLQAPILFLVSGLLVLEVQTQLLLDLLRVLFGLLLGSLDLLDLFLDFALSKLAALHFELRLLLFDVVSAFGQVVHDGVVDSLFGGKLLSQLLDFFLQLSFDLLVLTALAVLVTFQLAFSVLDVQLGFNLGLVDTLAHLLDVKLECRALLRERLHLLLELFSELLDFLVLFAFLFLKLSEPLLVF